MIAGKFSRLKSGDTWDKFTIGIILPPPLPHQLLNIDRFFIIFVDPHLRTWGYVDFKMAANENALTQPKLK